MTHDEIVQNIDEQLEQVRPSLPGAPDGDLVVLVKPDGITEDQWRAAIAEFPELYPGRPA